MAVAKVTSKGQVTIPQSVRRHLGLVAGDHVDFAIGDDGVVRLSPRSVDVLSLRGRLKARRRVSDEEMQRAIETGGTR